MTEVLFVKQPVSRKTCLKLLQVLVVMMFVLSPLGAGKAAADTTWTQTSQADFEAGTLVQLDTASSPGDVKLAKAGSDYLYVFRGNGTKTFWRYDIAANSWSALADAPQNVGAGGALAYNGANYIYAMGGGGSSYFWRYDITANTWSPLTSAPSSVNAGGALAYDGSNYIYALQGGTRNFWRYSISGGTWSTGLRRTFSTVYGGGALTYNGGDFIYAFRGASTSFWEYSISQDRWYWLAGTPSAVGDGGSLAADGSNYIYALKGSNTVTFWRYNISSNMWTAMADTPVTPCVYGGGSLVYDKNAHLYALRGNNEDDFWKYDVPGNAWSIKADTLAAVAFGGALAFRVAPYFASGNLTSSTYDTGGSSDFGNISWTATAPAGTALKFQIATNNDNATWLFKGPDGTTGTYYTSSGTAVWSGHDGDRYIKYKAFFSTANTGVTPVLQDVSITYSKQIVLPSAATADATLVEETTATFHGAVTDDGGEACQFRFEYGTATGNYTFNTGWTGNKTTGQSFSVDVTGLGKGMKYYFRAQVKNSAGIGSGGELNFLTKPDPPIDMTLIATVVSDTQIDLSWTKGEGAQKTMIRRKTGDFPVDRNDGILIYFDTGTSVSDTGLTPETLYYYRAWSYVSGSEQWSDGYRDITAKTKPAPPGEPIAIGGRVFPVNKAQVLAPWLGICGACFLITGGVVFIIVRVKRARR
jgi:hypothetical protein